MISYLTDCGSSMMIADMRYFHIDVHGFDDGRAVLLNALNIGSQEYLIQADDIRGIREDLLQTADAVEWSEITRQEYEDISRDRRGFYAPVPHGIFEDRLR
jgi:hypothetical protein